MADNAVMSAAVGTGITVVLREISHAGDTAQLPGSFLMGISGSEGAYTSAAINGDATFGLDVDVTRCALPANAATDTIQATQQLSLTSIDGKLPALGQALAAASVPIVLTAAQLATLTPPAAIAGFATSTLQTSTEVLIGAVTEAAAASDTASSGLSGRLQRIAQRLTDLIALLPASLGIKTAAASLSVAPASDAVFAASQNGTWNVGTVTTVTTVSTVTNLSQLGGTAIAMNTGVRSAGTQRVTIATDDVVPASQSGTWTVQPGNTANTTAWLVNDNPVTSGGLSVSSFLSTAAVQSTVVKASPGQVYAIEFFNVGATPMFVRLYNQTGAPAAGDNANIVWRGVIPGNTAGTGFVKSWDKGLVFATGIGMRCTGAIADTDNTALAANTIKGNVCYK